MSEWRPGLGEQVIHLYRLGPIVFGLVFMVVWTSVAGWAVVSIVFHLEPVQGPRLLVLGVAFLFFLFGLSVCAFCVLFYARSIVILTDQGLTYQRWTGKRISVPWEALHRVVHNRYFGSGIPTDTLRIEFEDSSGGKKWLDVRGLGLGGFNRSGMVTDAIVRRAGFPPQAKTSRYRHLGLTREEAWER